ncbi:MAG: DUF6677 family protein [Thermoguttaceae bacterium]
MPEPSEPVAAAPQVSLRDPFTAGVLAWLLPGLGHAYQGRYPKAVLFFVVILGTFLYGLWLGSDKEVGWGRVVYFSFRRDDLRLPYLCQVGIGLPALPALVQAELARHGKGPLCHALMAPPKLRASDPPALEPKDPGRKTVAEVCKDLSRFFELGTVYTMIAGLLNVLAIYDACCGPVAAEPVKKKEDEDQDEPKGEGSCEDPA